MRVLGLETTCDETAAAIVTAGEDGTGRSSGREHETMGAFEAIGKMPYDFSPARLRCMELAEELAAHESTAS